MRIVRVQPELVEDAGGKSELRGHSLTSAGSWRVRMKIGILGAVARQRPIVQAFPDGQVFLRSRSREGWTRLGSPGIFG